jgi:hypothetical protein
LILQRYVGLILFDGLSGAEESTMERIGDLTNIQVIGVLPGMNLPSPQPILPEWQSLIKYCRVSQFLSRKKSLTLSNPVFLFAQEKLTPTKQWILHPGR